MKLKANSADAILENIKEVSEKFQTNLAERQLRRELHKEDFDLLKEAGFNLMAVPVDQGGAYTNARESTRYLSDMLRILAHGDPSLALVASMHPAVISTWLEVPEAPEPYKKAWDEQSRWVFDTAKEGHWWGTIISEPGTGGDPSKSKAKAVKDTDGDGYRITGQKHFGSGSGMTSFMITVALAEGETAPDNFIFDMRGVPWDGSTGVTLIAPWDGNGMTATQSHGMEFKDMPATRTAWPDQSARNKVRQVTGRPGGHTFTAVIVGVIEKAIETAAAQLESKRDSMKAFEQVEWARVQMEGWLIQQAYEGVLREVEAGKDVARSALLCKESVAELAESVMLRITKVLGGRAYSRNQPYGFWLEDVRALGFLRPPWGFAFERIINGAWSSRP
jgi:alkylation response protein AidB-like acyl-CoA dehydrogenase